MNRKPMALLISVLLCVLLVGSATAQSDGPEAPEAAVSAAFTYQGQIKRNGALFTGTCDLQFKLWDAASGGVQVGSMLPANAVSVNNGVFAVALNFGNQFTGQARWIETAAKCADDAGFTTLPRVALTAAPYAIGLMPGAVISGNIPFGGVGSATFKAINPTDSGGAAVYGAATGAFGANAGVYGSALSPEGAGVWGNNDNGVGVLGTTFNGTGLWGDATTGTGVHGSSNSGVGVLGESTAWAGVYGESSSATGVWGKSTTGAGVVGESTAWVGVYGTSTDQAGVWGNSTFGFGVYGESTDQDAVHGLSHQTGHAGVAGRNDAAGGIGVYGNAPNSGYAGRFDGRVLIQSPLGTLPLVVKQAATEAQTPGLAVFETSNGTVGSVGADQGIFVVGAASGKALGLNVNSTTRALTIGSNGHVGIGTNIIGARLDVKGPSGSYDQVAFRVQNQDGTNVLSAYNNTTVGFGYPAPPTTSHTCWAQVDINHWFLATCLSAAEYVPTIDGGRGFPEIGDLVSIAPQVANPYDDDHSPFVVTKSTKPCDDTLLGLITDPEKRADGNQLNEHYLPLAIYGYFPAKVTTENGAIHRGDALTSSSKPGYAMKATQACKIIGYALEDADQDGTIQVFANLGESAAPEVATLRTQVEELSQTVADLQQENDALDQRLTALEQAAQGGQASTQSSTPREAVLLGALLIFGMVVVRRHGPDRNRGSK